MARTSCSNLSNFCCNSRKYRDVIRPWRDLSRQSRASSVIWWWVKLSTPSARGRTFSGEWFVIMSRSLSSIWAVAYKKKINNILNQLYVKLTASKVISDSVTFLYCLRRYESEWHDWRKKASNRKAKWWNLVQKSTRLMISLLSRL